MQLSIELPRTQGPGSSCNTSELYMLTKLKINKDQIRIQVWNQVFWEVEHQVHVQVEDQIRFQVHLRVGHQVWDQVTRQVRWEICDQVREDIKNAY